MLSPKTNKEIIAKGSLYVVDEACLSLKIFMGHVAYLQDKCDYIFIPRISCLKKNEKVCTNFLAIYDLVQNSFPHLKILNFNYDINDKEKVEGFLKIGRELNLNYFKVLNAYQKAEEEQRKYYYKQKLLIENKLKTNNLKIMIVAHAYNLEDEFIGKPIINYLKKENITVIPSIISDDEEINCSKISQTLYWTYNKQLMTFIQKYQNQVDGIILLSTFPCGPDSLTNELIIRKVKNIPISYITVDNNSSDTGLITRLESFIDIIKLKKERIKL